MKLLLTRIALLISLSLIFGTPSNHANIHGIEEKFSQITTDLNNKNHKNALRLTLLLASEIQTLINAENKYPVNIRTPEEEEEDRRQGLHIQT